MRGIHRLFPAAVLVFCLAAQAAAQDAIHWEPNLETAQRVAAQTNRLILIHCWAPWCGPCMKLEHEVFSQAETGRALEANFVMVKLNFDDAPGTVRHYGVTSLPSDVIVTPAGQVVSRVNSPPTTAMYIAQMNKIADGVKQPSKSAIVQDDRKPMLQQAVPAGSVAEPVGVSREIRPVQGYSDEPYADYYARPPLPGGASPQPPVDPQRSAGYNPDPVGSQSQQTVPAMAQSGLPPGAGSSGMTPAAPGPTQPAFTGGQPPVQSQRDARAQAASHAQLPSPAAKFQLPPGSPPLALDGFCPVALIQKKRWVLGDVRYGAYDHGRTYLFSGPEEQKQFLANPGAFAPVMSGNDPVLALDQRQSVPGRREFGAYFGNRIYLFSSEATFAQFKRNPNFYAAEALQAMR